MNFTYRFLAVVLGAVSFAACSSADPVAPDQEAIGSTSQALAAMHAFTEDGFGYFGGAFGADQNWLSGDFNGDGFDDAVNIFCETSGSSMGISIDVHPSNGDKWVNGAVRWQTRTGSCQPGLFGPRWWLAGDFNGDGKTDIAVVHADAPFYSREAAITVRLSTGSSFLPPVAWERRGGGLFATGMSDLTNEKWVVGDFNNDRKADIAHVFPDQGSASIDVHISSGNAFRFYRWQTQAGGYWNSQRWLAGDFNGDGKPDLANVFEDGGYASVDVHPSNGYAFNSYTRFATRQGGISNLQRWVAGDFDGDGITDLAKAFGDNPSRELKIDVHLSNRATFNLERWYTSESWRLSQFEEGNPWLVGKFTGAPRSSLVQVKNQNGWAVADVYVATNPLEPPTGLSVVLESNSRARITWRDNALYETGTVVTRNATEVARLPADPTTGYRTIYDNNLQPNTQYCYYVEVSDARRSVGSGSVCVRTNGVPNAPGDIVILIGDIHETSMALSWADRSQNELGFYLDRRDPNGQYRTITTRGVNDRYYTDTGLKPGTTYCYRVQAYNSYGASGYSPERCQTTLAPICPAGSQLQSYQFCMRCPGITSPVSYSQVACNKSDARDVVQRQGINCRVDDGACP